ncbi:MAG: diadenylate cyclase CdaA [Cytophagales bacterium]|nr:diadenylate cyclase CdaA [Cytophagales bacterium]MDW8384282.1 diadenylate cyclase CdaA [Flammeovirgaceae bacterium]
MMWLFHIGFLEVKWVDVIDITLVTWLIYILYKLMQGSIALRVFVGFLLLYFFYLIVRALQMELLSTILGQFMGVGVIAVLILFQQEIKKFLLLVGKTTELKDFHWRDIFQINQKVHLTQDLITPLSEAIRGMSQSQTGALIVIATDDSFKNFIRGGDVLDAKISKRLLETIFFKNSPLHDGACVIYKDRITTAGCILPVSENHEIPPHLGLRHRAAVGISELTDVLVVVVSEEKGSITCVWQGKIHLDISIHQLKKYISEFLLNKKIKNFFVTETIK